MKKIYYIAAAFTFMSFTACGDGVDLPNPGVETDLNKIPLPENELDLVQVELKDDAEPMVHPGFHAEEDFARIREKLEAGEEPWVSAYKMLEESSFAQKDTETWPVDWIKRGVSGDENYMNAARGASIAYQQALRWKIEGDDEYAAKAVANLNKWVQTCVGVTGNSNLSLAAGLYGYEFAIAGELLRDYNGCAFTQAIGGIHEVYFPFVLADLGLLLPLIVGGVAGSIWFSIFHCETAGVISPGSVLTILIMAGRSSMLPVLGGIFVSTAVSGVGSYLYLCWRGERKEVPQSEIPESEKQEELEKENTEMSGLERELETASEQEEKPMPENIYQNLHKIGFVCNGGMGSSAMGAALFRRALKTAGITGIQVEVYAADLIEEDIDLIVCQKEFYALNPQLHEKACHVIAGFTDREEYTKLIQCIQDAQNGGTR